MTKPPERFIPRDRESVPLHKHTGAGQFDHLFEPAHIDAINTAIACQRPLLLTGDPGVGKTQLARAAAAALGRAFVRHTVDAKTESRDLLWQFDAIARLADAQLAESLGWKQADCEQNLALKNYIRPGPLWWGLNWKLAVEELKATPPVQRDAGDPANGVVVLIDEIDKAEIDVPNGLLEALGEASFQPDGFAEPVTAGSTPPLVVITTNRERGLPDAFVRRCILLRIELEQEAEALKAQLVKRGRAHTKLKDPVLEDAAEQFVRDRQRAQDENWPYCPGQAEYLDLLRAIEELADADHPPERLLEAVGDYILCKGRYL